MAAGVPDARVWVFLGDQRALLVRHEDAVRLGRALARSAHADGLFSICAGLDDSLRSTSVFAASSTLHACVFAAFLIVASFYVVPDLATPDASEDRKSTRLNSSH